MMKWLLRAILVLATLLVVAIVVVWFNVRASLPQLDGEVAVSGLVAPATIKRDASGIPLISAASRADLAFATGFAHAQDRYFQMDLTRRQAAGELSEIFGSAALPVDRYFRFHRFRALAKAVLSTTEPTERALLESYARGVNAGLASLGKAPFEYLLLGKTPSTWRAEDTLLVVYAMFMDLNDSRARKDVRRGLAQRELPPSVYAWLYPDGTPWDAPMMGVARTPLPIPGGDVYSVRDVPAAARQLEFFVADVMPGSNNWAVSGAHTASGRAMVSNDMHLGLSVPNIYYRASLAVTGNDARTISGVTLPGVPFVVAGSNGAIAWGFTNSYGDWSDAIVVKPGATPGTYQTVNGDLPFTVHRETILVDDAEPEEIEIRATIWGPIDESFNYPDGEIAVRWIGHDARAVNLGVLQLESAKNVSEALTLANRIGIPPQNFVVGDADGNIGWTIAGQIPVRGDYDAEVPGDWSAGDGWLGWVEPANYPRIYNPPGGRIWTANARVANGEALETIGDGGYDLGARAAQIRDSLQASESFEVADMLAIQADDRALFLTPWRDLLLELLSDDVTASDAELGELKRLVVDWIPRAAPESVGYRLVRGFRLKVRETVFAALLSPLQAAYPEPVELLMSNQFEGPLWQVVTQQPLHLLPARYDSWNALMLEAARELVADLKALDGPLAERSWGEFNTARIQHPLSRAIPVLSRWLDMPAEPLAGDSNLPRAQGPTFGASERFTVLPGDEAGSLMQMPTGQSGHPLSEFYRKGHDDWVHARPSPFLAGAIEYTLTLAPLQGNMVASEL